MKKILPWFLFVWVSVCADIPEPYRSVKDLPFDGHGWFCNEKMLGYILQTKQPKKVIEVGSWLGLSTRFIAERIPRDGILYAIDTWKGSQNETVHLEDPRIHCLYQLFLSNVKHAGLTEKIVPIRMESLEAAEALNVQADLIYIDASHDTESVYKDIIAWSKHIKSDGMICGDDWSWESVRIGVGLAAQQLKRNVRSSENFWWFD